MESYPRNNTNVLFAKMQKTETALPIRLYVGVIYLVVGLILYLCTS
ncbi:hypothetical protein [Desulfosporosinus sp. Sb-LF]|nr:hypothetical protein [Desulfosporosinus sp. Sb-LF]